MSGDDKRFHHHPYLATVAQEDVRFVLEKDRSYGASWKLSGGRSAWFMLKRKIDRMVEMMRRPTDPVGLSLPDYDDMLASGEGKGEVTMAVEVAKYMRDCFLSEDIFGMIERDPSGDDGCVLAEVRDLRRYLLLVEAEMVARGVVSAPEVRLGAIFERGPDGKGRVKPEWKEHLATLDRGNVPDIKKMVERFLSWKLPESFNPDGGVSFERTFNNGTMKHEPSGTNLLDYSQAEQMVCHMLGLQELRRVPRYTTEPSRPGTPDDGGHHEQRLQEVVTRSEYMALTQDVRERYYLVLRDPICGDGFPCVNGPICYLLDRGQMTEEWVEEHCLRLSAELNSKEFSETPSEYRGLYELDQGTGSWRMKLDYLDRWAKQ